MTISETVAREMASSKQALGILSEYGKSKPRVWLEYGWSMARVWLEHLFFRQERTFVPSGTNSFSVGNGLRALRYAVMVILMMVVGVSEVWGQTPDYSGTYYIGSDYQTPSTTIRNYDPTDLTNNFYLCPTENWISFGSSGETKDTWTTGDDKPFLTTYKACLHANDYNLAKAKWTIEYYATISGKDYYYIKHSSGKYLVLNKQIDGVSGNNNQFRIRVHLESLTSMNETTRNNALFTISRDDRSYVIDPKTQPTYYLTVNKGNGDYLQGENRNSGGQVSSYYLAGTIGIYKGNTDDTKYLYLEEVKCATPTISYNNSSGELTITSNTVGATIKYTTDGTDPSTGTTYDDSNKPVINTRTVVKAIAQKTYKEDSEVITQTIVVSPVIDPIASVTYNGSEQEPTVTVKDGETTISADEYTVSYSDNINAGTATVTITDKEGGDYIVYGSGSFTIDRKTLTITADDATKVYDGTALTKNTYINTTLATGDAIESVTFTGSQTVVGTSNNVPSAAVIKNSSDVNVTASYDITYSSGTLEVTPKSLTITADDATKEYDGTALTNGGYTHTALATGDVIISVTVTGSQTVRGDSDNVPSEAVIKNNNGNGDDVTACYDITYVNGTLSVTGKVITITAGSDTKVYDGTALTNDSYTYDNTKLYSGDVITSVTMTGSQTVAGSSANVPSGAVIMNGENDVTENYSVTYVNGTLTVTQKALTITADNATKVYDGTPLQKETFTNTELASGDNITSVTFTGSQTVVGTSNNVPSAAAIKNAGDDDVSASYNITYTNGTLEVTPASATVKANDSSKTYGDADPTLTATVTGLVNNELESLITINTVSRTYGEDVGTYTITPTGEASQGNYTVNYVAGTFTITPKALNKDDAGSPAEGITITITKDISSEPFTYNVVVKLGESILTQYDESNPTTPYDYTVSGETSVSGHVAIVTAKEGGNYTGFAKAIFADPMFERPDEITTEYAAVYLSLSDMVPNPPDGVTLKAYIVKKVNPTIGTITISPVEYTVDSSPTKTNYIPEGVPVLLLSNSTNTEGLSTSPMPENTTGITESEINSNQLLIAPEGGVYVKDAQAYMFYGGEFVLTKKGTIGKDKFFIYNPNYTETPAPTPPSQARHLRFVIEGEEDPDGMDNGQWTTDDGQLDDAWYTLDGRKLNGKPTQKGMYITNGKKRYFK